MQAILFCDRQADCIPLHDCPEALLPVCGKPMLAILLQYLETHGFTGAVLVAADSRVQRLPDTIPLQMPVRFVRSLAALRTEECAVLLRRLCIPDWDMGELHALCAKGAARLTDAHGTPLHAEVHPAGSSLLEPEETAVIRESRFFRASDPAEYRALQQHLLECGTGQQTGEGLRADATAKCGRGCIIGNDCVLGAHVLLEDTVLGDGVQIGDNAVLTGCVVCRGALIEAGAHLEGSVIPEGAVVPHDARRTHPRRLLVLPEDGICCGVPGRNSADTALQAGAAMTALGRGIAIGYSHPQGESLALAAAAGASAQGARVWLAGRCALSQLVYTAEAAGCEAVLWAEGEQVFRLLPYRAGGLPLTESQTARLWRALEARIGTRLPMPGSITDAGSFAALWETECLRMRPARMPAVQIGCASPVLRQAAQRILGNGSGEQITLTLREDGSAAAAFSMEAGMLRSEQLVLLAMGDLEEPAVLPEDFHPAAEDYGASQGLRIIRMTGNADAQTIRLYDRQALFTDGVRLMLHVLRVLSRQEMSLREAAQTLPRMCTMQRTVVSELSRRDVEQLRRSASPQIRMARPAGSRLVQLRVHADSMEAAAELCGEWERRLHEAEKNVQ